MAQYPKTESVGSIGSIILAILEVQVALVKTKRRRPWHTPLGGREERLVPPRLAPEVTTDLDNFDKRMEVPERADAKGPAGMVHGRT